MDWVVSLSKIGRKVVPPSLDFHTPPEAAPTSMVVLPSGSARAAMAAMRPLMAAEPMLRAPRPEMVALLNAGCPEGDVPGADLGAAMAAATRVELSIVEAARTAENLTGLTGWLLRTPGAEIG